MSSKLFTFFKIIYILALIFHLSSRVLMLPPEFVPERGSWKAPCLGLWGEKAT
jgi:hypothetical protein